MRLNYQVVISTLLGFSDRIAVFETGKNQKVLNYLCTQKTNVSDDNAPVPDLKEIASAVGLPRQKVNQVVKDLYTQLIASFILQPIEIKKAIISICIDRPLEEVDKKDQDPEYQEALRKKAVYVDVTLPFLPRIGEEISFSFFDRDSKYNWGYVHDVQHYITASEQRIVIFVDSSRNYYYKWAQLKQTFEKHERSLASLQSNPPASHSNRPGNRRRWS